jgi:hypothetical protein
MAPLKEVVTELMAMLDGLSEEAKELSGTTERLTNWFEQESKRLIMESLDTILSEVMRNDPEDPFKPHLLMSANGRVSTLGTDHAKPQGYQLLTVGELLRLIRSLESQVAGGKWVPAVEFIKANRKVRGLTIRPAARVEQSKPVVTERPGWKPSDFLPAPPPYPPLPRGLFKD